jgi:hypothetical protein
MVGHPRWQELEDEKAEELLFAEYFLVFGACFVISARIYSQYGCVVSKCTGTDVKIRTGCLGTF